MSDTQNTNPLPDDDDLEVTESSSVPDGEHQDDDADTASGGSPDADVNGDPDQVS